MQRYSDTAFNTLVGQTQIGYDGLGITNSITHKNAAGSTLESFSYTIDVGGRLSSETDNTGTNNTINYGYDQADQLTSANGTTYGFDLNGNRNNGTFQVGPNNQLSTDGSWNFGYDPQGNLTKKTGIGANAGLVWVLSYNAANQLVGATETQNGTQIVQETNKYDGYGNWIEQDVTQGGNTTVTTFAHQVVNNDPGTVGQAPTWLDSTSVNGGNPTTTRRIWALDQVFARIGSTGTIDYPLTDRLGSVWGLMNTIGTLDDILGYDASGNKTSESNPSAGDRYGYAGGQYDSYLIVDLFGARWYNIKDQTWLSQDPLGLAAGTNPYTYGDNAAVNFTDPTGLETLREFLQRARTQNATAYLNDEMRQIFSFSLPSGVSLARHYMLAGVNGGSITSAEAQVI